MWDYDIIGSNDFLGEAIVDLTDLVGEQDLWVKLDKVRSGELHLRLSFSPTNLSPTSSAPPQQNFTPQPISTPPPQHYGGTTPQPVTTLQHSVNNNTPQPVSTPPMPQASAPPMMMGVSVPPSTQQSIPSATPQTSSQSKPVLIYKVIHALIGLEILILFRNN